MPRILIVDDDMNSLAMLRENLMMEGYRVTCGYDGQMALRMARQETPDLMVLDIQMPMTNGLKTLKYLRAFERTAQVPVILISGNFKDEDLAEIALAPRVAFFQKPLDLTAFNTTVAQFLQRYPVYR